MHNLFKTTQLTFLAAVLLLMPMPAHVAGQPAVEQPGAAPAAAPSLLKNGNFEEGNLEPTAWRKGASVEGVEYLWTTGVAFRGKASLCIRKTENRFWPIAQWQQDVAHDGSARRMTVEARIKAQDAAKAVIDVQFRDAAGAGSHAWAIYIGAKNSGDPPATHDWKLCSGTVDIPEGTTAFRVAFQMYGPGVVAIDDIAARYEAPASGEKPGASSLAAALAAETQMPSASPTIPSADAARSGQPMRVEAADAPANGIANPAAVAAAPPGAPIPLLNPGFEEGATEPAGWNKGANIPGVEYIWSKDAARSGAASLCLRKTANRYFPIAQWSQTFEKDRPARMIRVAAWVKCDSVTKAILDVQFVDSQDKWSHQWAAYIGAKQPSDPPVTHDWTRYVQDVPIPLNTSQITIAPQIYGPGTVWFDDLEAFWIE